MSEYIVYKHITPNNKIYIGITSTSLKLRSGSNGYKYKRNKLFYRAIQKYGWNNIKHEILFINLSKEDACKKEQELIELYKSNNAEYGYNLSSGGESGHKGVKASLETRQKMSIAHLGNKSNTGKHLSEETKRKMRGRIPWNKGKKGLYTISDETRKKMSDAQKGAKNHFYGKHHTPEAIEKIKLSHSKKEVICNG